jgi:hypothetical protein
MITANATRSGHGFLTSVVGGRQGADPSSYKTNACPSSHRAFSASVQPGLSTTSAPKTIFFSPFDERGRRCYDATYAGRKDAAPEEPDATHFLRVYGVDTLETRNQATGASVGRQNGWRIFVPERIL